MSFVLFAALACGLAGAVAVLASVFAEMPDPAHSVAVVAHRAGAGTGPENTIAAIRKAIELGVDYVELDVRATRDGRLVLMHDRTVDRSTTGTGEVKNFSFDDIRALDAGVKFSPALAGEKVPTFEEALAVCHGHVNVYLDHKNAPTAQVIAALNQYGMERSVVVYVNTAGQHADWKRLAPAIPVMCELPDDCRRAGGVAELERRLTAEVLDGHMVEWTAALVAQAHEEGVLVYTDIMGETDDAEGYRRALAMGVDGIQTDHPDRLLAFLAGQ